MSLTASELYLASATLPISWTFVNSGYGFRLCTDADDAGSRFVPVEHPLQTIAVRAEVADFERRRAAELTLDVEQVLEHVRRLAIGHVAEHVDVRQAHQRRRHAAVVRGAAAASERRVERQVRRQQQRVVAAASRQVARHVEPRVAGVLHVEDAGAGAERPLLARVPRPADPRREVLLVVVDQAVAQRPSRATWMLGAKRSTVPS